MKVCKPDVICAYPITPQTPIVERLAEFVARGELKSAYVPIEGEHSAMVATVAAAAAGARTFTATSSQGLAYMQEGLFYASGYRLPIVMAQVNRSMGAPWTILPGHDDTIAQRDSGWIQAYCSQAQEVLDMIIQAYKIAEDRRVMVPFMVCFEGFVISHCYELVDVPSQEAVDGFLPPYDPLYKLDVDDPMTITAFAEADWWLGFKKLHNEAVEATKKVVEEVDESFLKHFGRSYGGLIGFYRMDDAKVALITMGSLSLTSKLIVDKFRREGVKLGLVNLRFFRPFPREKLIEALESVEGVCIVERNVSPGAYGGAVFNELRSTLYSTDLRPLVLDFLAGMGGRDVTPAELEMMVSKTLRAVELRKVEHEVEWIFGRRRA